VPDNHYGYASSLLVNGNTVIVQYDNNSAGKVMALNLANGNVVWSKARKEQATWSSPTMASIGGRNMLLLMGNPNIVALNPNNGEQLWAVDCMSGEVGASLCASNGIVFGASENAKMVAINGSTGEQLWESTEYLPEIASPTANKNLVYIATSYGVMAAFDVQTGQLVKDHDLGNQFYSSPMLVDGKLYVAGTDGKFYIFSTDKEFRLLQTVTTGEKTFATPAFTDGKMVVRTNNSLYCVAKK
jgi:outer membrane protein assembly factor BamB